MKKADLICMWCGEKTTGKKEINGIEHIFPVAIGGIKTLSIGLVCKKCNHELGNLDESLKFGHPEMMHSYQLAPGLGRKRSKVDKDRKKREKSVIHGKEETASSEIIHNESFLEYLNTNHTVTSEKFVRALHKCLANVLCDMHGSIFVGDNYPELLNFVKNGGDVRPWSYAVSYPMPFYRPLIPEPQAYVFFDLLMCFIHTSGIWMLGSHPFALSPKIITKISDSINKLSLKNETNPQSVSSLTDFYGVELHPDRSLIGSPGFLWVVKEIEGNPNDDSIYLLTKCRICGQINPTGQNIPRDIIQKENGNESTIYCKNTWNYTNKEDVNLELRNDIKKIKINNRQIIKCLSCGSMIEFSDNDCFI